MGNRITFRLDEELTQLLSSIQCKSIFNLSALAREALREKLSNYFGGEKHPSDKGKVQG